MAAVRAAPEFAGMAGVSVPVISGVYGGPTGAHVFIIDAFTTGPFTGNPAGVVVSRSEPSSDWMQAFAAELGFAETAFAVPESDAVRLRWFTPTAEVDLCGHATLAAAGAMWLLPGTSPGPIAFKTRSGTLVARQASEPGVIELDFPREDATRLEDSSQPETLSAALGLAGRPAAVAANRFDLLVELPDEASVRSLIPDFATIAQLPWRGLIVTAEAAPATRETTGADFVSRFFAPAVGVDEDPVTGSAHCALGPWWAERFGRRELTGLQASRRSGIVRVRVEERRVQLGGTAHVVVRGRLGPADPGK